GGCDVRVGPPELPGEIARALRTGVVVLAAGVRIKARSRTGEESSMPANPPKNMTRVTPYLYYEDVASALDWLVKAFGFRERMRMPGPGGKIMHAEVELADGVVMMGHPGPEFQKKSRGNRERLYPSLAFASMRDELCLQAADVLVYDKCRWMQTWVRPQQ